MEIHLGPECHHSTFWTKERQRMVDADGLGVTLLGSPARKFVEIDNDRLDKCPLRVHSVRIPPSAVSGSPAPCGWSGRPSPSWSPLLGGRQPLRCRSGLSVGRSTSGRPPPWCPQGGLLPAGTRWTLWQTGGDCNAIAGV